MTLAGGVPAWVIKADVKPTMCLKRYACLTPF